MNLIPTVLCVFLYLRTTIALCSAPQIRALYVLRTWTIAHHVSMAALQQNSAEYSGLWFKELSCKLKVIADIQVGISDWKPSSSYAYDHGLAKWLLLYRYQRLIWHTAAADYEWASLLPLITFYNSIYPSAWLTTNIKLMCLAEVGRYVWRNGRRPNSGAIARGSMGLDEFSLSAWLSLRLVSLMKKLDEEDGRISLAYWLNATTASPELKCQILDFWLIWKIKIREISPVFCFFVLRVKFVQKVEIKEK